MLQPITARNFLFFTATLSLLTFDWGSAALAYLYYKLDTVCRGACHDVRLLARLAYMLLYPFLPSLSLASFLFTKTFLFRFGVSRLDSFEASALLALIKVFY